MYGPPSDRKKKLVDEESLRQRIRPAAERIICLDRHETHVLSIDSLRDSFCIKEVVLVGLHKWPHELSRNELHSWPCSRRARRRKTAPAHASRSISVVCRFAVKVISCLWVNFLFSSTLPLSPSATR